MKKLLSLLFPIILLCSCNSIPDKAALKEEIFNAEKAFNQMAAEQGIAEAFYFFADDEAVILRENDTLIKGKENIKMYYSDNIPAGTSVNWSPDFIEVSECGSLAYTYGKYLLKVPNQTGDTSAFTGVFHTVWKKQEDDTWKYVWD